MQFEGNVLPAACPSPRIVGGVLKWYAGDVFDLQVQILLTDHNGEELSFAPEHTVQFLFRNHRGELVHEVTFCEIEENTVVLRFTEDVTNGFPCGNYTYDVIYKGIGRRTLVDNAPICVEGGKKCI